MATLLSDQLVFNAQSAMDYHTKSVTQATALTYNGWSFSSGFNPLRTVNPNTTDAALISRYLATLIMDLYKPR